VEAEDFSSTICVQPALGPNQPLVQWIPGIFPRGKCGQGILLTAHALLVPWVKKERGCTFSSPICQKWCVVSTLYLYVYTQNPPKLVFVSSNTKTGLYLTVSVSEQNFLTEYSRSPGSDTKVHVYTIVGNKISNKDRKEVFGILVGSIHS
jgi:hypothetical protein